MIATQCLNKARLGYLHIAAGILSIAVAFFSSMSIAQTVGDIRAVGRIDSFTDRVDYVVYFPNCSSIATFDIEAGTFNQTLSPSEATAVPDSPTGCQYAFSAIGADLFHPRVVVHQTSGATFELSESYVVEKNPPAMQLTNVGLSSVDGTSLLVATVNVTDDVDVTYVGFDVSGLRASELRAAGGLVAKAKETAFARSSNTQRVYPSIEGQSEFTVALPITRPLDADAIAHDGLVLADIVAVDASGNQTTLSKIRFTGDDVKEQALALTVAPSNLILTSLLDSATLTPSVQFQFRGLTPLAGAGQGVTFTSSHPDLVAVTSSGIAYPLRETVGTQVKITVSYPGLEIIVVPVVVDFSKQLVSLEMEGLDANHMFRLPRLNDWISLPAVRGVFDDGSRREIQNQSLLDLKLGIGSTGILEMDGNNRIRARAAISEAIPVNLNIALKAQPDVAVVIPVVAADAVPEVNLGLSGNLQAAGTIDLSASATDDVAIQRVEFYIDGVSITSIGEAPYRTSLQIPETWANQKVTFGAVAIDRAGQRSVPHERSVTIPAKRDTTVPILAIAQPRELQTFIESTPIKFQVEREVSVASAGLTREIGFVEFAIDGARVATSYFPIYEKRQVTEGASTREAAFEVWLAEAILPPTSTDESARAVHAIAHGVAGMTAPTLSRLIKVAKNRSPAVRVLTPLDGAQISVGQQLVVDVEVSDDTLAAGTAVDVLVNDRLVQSTRIQGQNASLVDNFIPAVQTRQFVFTVGEDLLGTALILKASATDYHGNRMLSAGARLNVKEDRPPAVSLSHPQEGSRLTGGVAVELRAEATDDVGVARVDFYVNDKRVGSDTTPPYAINFDTPIITGVAQLLTIHAVAVDTKGQSSSSGTVNVALDKDGERPVVNIAAPPLTGIEAGVSIADVIEKSDVVLKITGHDNVGVSSLELTGIAIVDGVWTLTGKALDRVGAEQLKIETVPGTINAFSVSRLIKIPIFTAQQNVDRDLYAIGVVAADAAANKTEKSFTLAVKGDRAPVVEQISADQASYKPRDVLQIDVRAADDKAVTGLRSALYVDGAASAVLVQEQTTTQGLVPAAKVLERFTFDLASLVLSNTAHELRIIVTAIDDQGQSSATSNVGQSSVVLAVVADTLAPVLAIQHPLPGSVVYRDQPVIYTWEASDESRIDFIEFHPGTAQAKKTTLGQRTGTGQFTFTVPSSGSMFELKARGRDVYGNESSYSWRFPVENEAPPIVSVRAPADGVRVVEGELLDVVASVADNRTVSSATLFIEVDGVMAAQKQFSSQQLASLLSQNSYLSQSFRVPKGAGNTVLAGVRATDDQGQTSTATITLEVNDDIEAPRVTLLRLTTALSVIPGDTIPIVVSAEDDNYVANLEVRLVASNGSEMKLPWTVFSRQDRIEQVSIPNPTTLGQVVIDERFHVDATGLVTVPLDLLQHVSETYALVVLAEDLGVNTVRSATVPVVIAPDREPPSTNVISPPATVYDRQPLALDVELSDNVGLKSYKIFLAGRATPLAEKAAVTGKFIRLQNVPIDLAWFGSVQDQDKTASLVVQVTDLAGNTQEYTRTISIKPDRAPILALNNVVPPSAVLQGSLLFFEEEVADDYASMVDPLHYFPVLTSLSAEHNGQPRRVALRAVTEDQKIRQFVQFDYPEGSTFPFTVRINDQRYAEASSEGLRIESSALSSGLLTVDVPTGNTVTFHVHRYSDEQCTALLEEISLPVGQALDLSQLLNNASFSLVEIVIHDAAGNRVVAPLKALQVHGRNLADARQYQTTDQRIVQVSASAQITLVVADGESATAYVTAAAARESASVAARTGYAVPIPADPDLSELRIYGAAYDRYSHERPAVVLQPQLTLRSQRDSAAPSVRIRSPETGYVVRSHERVTINIDVTDNSNGVRSVKLIENGARVVREIGGEYMLSSYSMPYDVPADATAGELNLTVIATDMSGNASQHTVTLPIGTNEPPQIGFKRFSHRREASDYGAHIADPQRLNYAEYWLRNGEEFRVELSLMDDAGLQNVSFARLNADGRPTLIETRVFDTTCPQVTSKNATPFFESRFDQVAPTQYELTVTDTAGNQSRRRFIVHPVSNMQPVIRLAAPANEQFVVNGTFLLQVGIVTSDDRPLAETDIEVLANGLPLSRIGPDAKILNAAQIAGDVVRAYGEIYDMIEQNYSVDLADQYGMSDSPYAMERGYLYAVPSSAIEGTQKVRLTARVHDSDGATGWHVIQLNIAPDTINPEVALIKPDAGFALVEGSDLTLALRAYDNVKVNQIEVYAAYGAKLSDETYLVTPYGSPVRVIDNIPSADFFPLSTQNIDTPEYAHVLHVARRHEVARAFSPGITDPSAQYDVWVKIIARDGGGNTRTRELSFRITDDQAPSVDIIQPVATQEMVEGAPVAVTVSAFDDVAIDSVRLTVVHGAQELQIFNKVLRTPPYTYQFTTPLFSQQDANANSVTLRVEAVDSYGATLNNASHRAFETMTFPIRADSAPVIQIAKPENGSSITEGSVLVVQVNAIDDLALDRVTLHVRGLMGGDKTLVDTEPPYDFPVDVPYGQAGHDLALSATAVEKRYNGVPRSVTTPVATILHVGVDTQAPTLTVRLPTANGATVVEKRSLDFLFDASDNVKVSTVTVHWSIDRNRDGQYQPDETSNTVTLLRAPYGGSVGIGTFADYLSNNDSSVTQLTAKLTAVAVDGAGNKTVLNIPVTITRNAPPRITSIELLDTRGLSLGTGLTEVTEGRQIVVHAIAEDEEVGVKQVTLLQALGAVGAALNYQSVGDDQAAPFQFHIEVPKGRVGQTLSFKARALDMDGWESSDGSPLNLLIKADKPPVVRIIEPANDQSVIVDGQRLTVRVEAVDDLGATGIDRVVLYVNGTPVDTLTASVAEMDHIAGKENEYRFVIDPPAGATGFAVQAVAYDVVGHSASSTVIRVGKVEDTIAPKVSPLHPVDGEVVTEFSRVQAVVVVDDMGSDLNRSVIQTWIREYQTPDGEWTELGRIVVPLKRDDVRATGDTTPVSNPDKNEYIYWTDVVSASVLKRENRRNERVRVATAVVTPNHTTTIETKHEIGLRVAQRAFWLDAAPLPDGTLDPENTNRAQQRYYTAVDQFRSTKTTGALVAAWATRSPARSEQGLGLVAPQPLGGVSTGAETGLFIVDQVSELLGGDGKTFVYNDWNHLLPTFTGTIGEVHADSDFVLAAKSGLLAGDASGSGNPAGELLVFTVQNGDQQFGLPYQLAGRVDLPYSDVYGVTRADDLALVANGNGGVQVIDISNLAAPYRIGYIKGNGFARDVATRNGYAFIASSHEGIIVADLSDPSLPIVARLDTTGVANRVKVHGDRLYVTDMAGSGGESQLHIISIADPHRPQLLKSVALTPTRRDAVADGSFDVTVAGSYAYVTVLYSNQEDQPLQSLVEVVDLNAIGALSVDATVPALVHSIATPEDFEARGVVVARGGLQVASGRQGLGKIEFNALTVVSHEPAQQERNILTNLPTIEIELSAPLSPNTSLRDVIRVMEQHPTIGLDVGARFDFGFAQRTTGPDYARIVLTRRADQTLTANEQYFVVVSKGLAPVVGMPLQSEYVTAFSTAATDASAAPEIVSSTPALGSIAGGTVVDIRGHHFGASPEITIGGRRLLLDSYTAANSSNPYDVARVTTLPNYAGPAAVVVTSQSGLSDKVMGGFTYVDLLEISFISPSVVRVDQSGLGDEVDIIGYGFHAGIELRVSKSDSTDAPLRLNVDQAALKLLSSERMKLRVPSLGKGYRGYVDVEVRDAQGRRALRPRAMFYGQIQTQRRLLAEQPIPPENLADVLNGKTSFVPDPLKLPPGRIADVAVDAERDLVYVLGQGVLPDKVTPQTTVTLDAFRASYAPGWISLVHYDANAVDQAAPMHGLGYMNLPQDVTPRALHFAGNFVYVLASGYSFPYIDTPYDGRQWLLVYERETRNPASASGTARDRDVLYRMPLDFVGPPDFITGKDDLLFVGQRDEGIAVISLRDPRQPSIMRTLRGVSVDGQNMTLRPLGMEVLPGGRLHATVVVPAAVPSAEPARMRAVFDINQPALPLLALLPIDGPSAALRDTSTVVESHKQRPLSIFDVARDGQANLLGRYEVGGFDVAGEARQLNNLMTLSGVVKSQSCVPVKEIPIISERSYRVFAGLFDVGRAADSSLVDATPLSECTRAEWVASELSDDGVLVAATATEPGANLVRSELLMLNTFLPDLVSTYPSANEVGVATNVDVALRFSHAITIPAGETEGIYLARYLAMIYDDGSTSGVPIAFSAQRDSQNTHSIIVTPNAALSSNSIVRFFVKSELGARRSRGLADFSWSFTTGSGSEAPPQILSLSSNTVLTRGGEVDVLVANSVAPTFLVGGQTAVTVSTIAQADGSIRYRIAVPGAVIGPAALTVVNAGGGRASRLGAIEYVEPLELLALEPKQGTVNGGTPVRLQGRGFNGDAMSTEVFFGDAQVAAEQIQRLDGQTLLVTTPPGQIGTVTVVVKDAKGQVVTLTDGFEYQQPIQSNIRTSGDVIYDAVTDPTGVYVLAAAGRSGLRIYNVDASTYTAGNSQPLNLDDLRRTIDRDGNGVDDRLVTDVKLPEDLAALGVHGYFERGIDRVYVAAAQLDVTGKPIAGSARFLVYGIDAANLAQTTLIKNLPLASDYARGMDSANHYVAVAMGSRGIGLIDTYLHTKSTLAASFSLPNQHSALDVSLVTNAQGLTRLAVVAGQFDFAQNKLINTSDVATGGFYLVENNATSGMANVGSVPVPASRVVVQDHYAFLAAGEAGVVVVDIADPRKPQVVNRLTSLGFVYDVDVQGGMLYVARGDKGVATVDITNPAKPLVLQGMEAYPGNALHIVVAGRYGAYSFGRSGIDTVVQVTPDVVLKVHGLDPVSRIVAPNAAGNSEIRVRFNKAIDVWPQNAALFSLVTAAGVAVPVTITISNNDAVIRLAQGHSLRTGDPLVLRVKAGVVVATVDAQGAYSYHRERRLLRS